MSACNECRLLFSAADKPKISNALIFGYWSCPRVRWNVCGSVFLTKQGKCSRISNTR